MIEEAIQNATENNITDVMAEEISNATSILSNISEPVKSAVPTFIIATDTCTGIVGQNACGFS